MRDPRDVILAPVVSEKSYDLIEQANTYTFRVDPRANKTEIRQAVETLFDVTVTRVNTVNRQGKRKRNRSDWTFGRQAHRKHAFVQLALGDNIPIFEGA